MKDERILTAACIHVGCLRDQVMKHRILDDHVVLVVNRGIAGCPKYTVSLAGLEEMVAIATRLGDAMGKGVFTPVPADQLEPPEAEADVAATPSARRLAQERGVELASVAGSGAGGRILKRDVEATLC